MLLTSLPDIQAHLQREKLDGWLLYDFRGSSLSVARLLPAPGGAGAKKRFTTRRLFLYIPARGPATILVHGLDANAWSDVLAQCDTTRLVRASYLGWRDLHAWLAATVTGRVAMDYAPGCSLPVVSNTDAGTLELVRALGAEVVSSADVQQAALARWGDAAYANHQRASALVDQIKEGLFAMIGAKLAAREPVNEYQAQQWVLDAFKKHGLETPDGPIVAVNAHAGDPHFDVSPTNPSPIRKGDWVLLDLWARVPGDENIFSDVTWTAFAGTPAELPPRHLQVFTAVVKARDAALALAQQRSKANQPVRGHELDDAARSVLINADLGEFIRHRTGHSLSPGPLVHGVGMNLDNLETHDTRTMLPGTGFTIEPGAYLPEFGVRSEINVYVDPAAGPVVTSGTQRDPIFLMR
jgi:Xaa-Pro aminopeptidase